MMVCKISVPDEDERGRRSILKRLNARDAQFKIIPLLGKVKDIHASSHWFPEPF